MPSTPTRRRFLASTGAAAGAVALPGCASLPFVGPVRERWRVTVDDSLYGTREPLAFDDRNSRLLVATGETLRAVPVSGDGGWRREFRAELARGPATADGRAFVVADRLVALDPAGADVWSVDGPGVRGEGRVTAGPVVAGPLVVVGTVDGRVQAYRREDGTGAWTATPFGDAGPPVDELASDAAGGRIYAATGSGLAAVDVAAGRAAWIRERTVHDVTAAGGRVHTVTERGVGTREADTGDELWHVDGPAATAVTAADGRVYVTAGEGQRDRRGRFPPGRLVALDGDGRERWRVGTDGYAWTPPTVADGRVYVARNYGNGVTAVTTAGDRRWSYGFAGDRQPFTRPLVRDAVYVGVENEVVALEERA